MLDAAFAMYMAMLDFFFTGRADGSDFDIKVELLARQRMVAIHGDGVVLDLGDGNHQGAALGIRLKLHAWLYVIDPLKGVTRYFLNQRSEEHTSELQSRPHLVCRLLLEKK